VAPAVAGGERPKHQCAVPVVQASFLQTSEVYLLGGRLLSPVHSEEEVRVPRCQKLGRASIQTLPCQ